MYENRKWPCVLYDVLKRHNKMFALFRHDRWSAVVTKSLRALMASWVVCPGGSFMASRITLANRNESTSSL
jgi:hypothetical protein